jgi:hypothetical protein
MFGQGLRQVQNALNAKADALQREFVAISERLNVLNRKVLEVPAEERPPLLAEQETLRDRRSEVAEAINTWRDRAKEVMQQPGDDALRTYLTNLLEVDDEAVQGAAKHALYLLDAPEDELAALAQSNAPAKSNTPAGRLLERARTSYDLRGNDPAPRMQAAAEFANRPNMAQDDQAVAEIEAAMNDADAAVKEVATLTAIQLHRFRALRLADLDVAHHSVEKLITFDHRAVIPVLIAILETPRTGYAQNEAGAAVEGDNTASRRAALQRLIEWRTPEVRAALLARQLDRDPQISQLATEALQAPAETWTGPAKK